MKERNSIQIIWGRTSYKNTIGEEGGRGQCPKKQVFLREDFLFKAQNKDTESYPFSTRWGMPLYKGSDTAENTPEVPKHIEVGKGIAMLYFSVLWMYMIEGEGAFPNCFQKSVHLHTCLCFCFSFACDHPSICLCSKVRDRAMTAFQLAPKW